MHNTAAQFAVLTHAAGEGTDAAERCTARAERDTSGAQSIYEKYEGNHICAVCMSALCEWCACLCERQVCGGGNCVWWSV